MAKKKLQFADLKDWIVLLDTELVEIEAVWAKRAYHQGYLQYKDNVTFTVRKRTDIMPGFFVRVDGYDFPVANVSQVSQDFTVLECTLAPDLYPT